MKEIAREFHLGWAEWIVGWKRQSCREHTTLEARPLWSANMSTQQILRQSIIALQ